MTDGRVELHHARQVNFFEGNAAAAVRERNPIMITPAVTVVLIILGWGAVTAAMLWGLRRVLRHHHRHEPNAPIPRLRS